TTKGGRPGKEQSCLRFVKPDREPVFESRSRVVPRVEGGAMKVREHEVDVYGPFTVRNPKHLQQVEREVKSLNRLPAWLATFAEAEAMAKLVAKQEVLHVWIWFVPGLDKRVASIGVLWVLTEYEVGNHKPCQDTTLVDTVWACLQDSWSLEQGEGVAVV